MSSLPLLSAKKLTCIREQRILFEHLDFDVYAGELWQVEGPNGAGKTSLLRLLAGLSQPYDGQVEHKGNNIADVAEEYHQSLLYLGHQVGVKAGLTAEENLSFNLALNGYDASAAEAALQEVQLLGFEDALASHLSAGQHRRISLARLWHTQAKVWILDEPFTALDKQGVAKLEALILQHIDQGGCVIMTTHQDLVLAKSRCQTLKLEYRYF